MSAVQLREKVIRAVDNGLRVSGFAIYPDGCDVGWEGRRCLGRVTPKDERSGLSVPEA
jgi:hypothetical protein